MRALSTTHRRSPWGAGDRPQAPPPAGGPPAEASHGHVLLSLQKSVISIVIPADPSCLAGGSVNLALGNGLRPLLAEPTPAPCPAGGGQSLQTGTCDTTAN